jgi:hypothetical protein
MELVTVKALNSLTVPGTIELHDIGQFIVTPFVLTVVTLDEDTGAKSRELVDVAVVIPDPRIN